MRDEKRVRMKDGRSGISGMCTACGGKIFRMVGADEQKPKARYPVRKKKRKARESSRQQPSIKNIE